MASEEQLTNHRHTFDVTIAPVCAVCGLPLTEVLQVAQEEHAAMQQLAQADQDLEVTSEHLKDARHYLVYKREELAQARALIKDAAHVIDAEWGAADEGPDPWRRWRSCAPSWHNTRSEERWQVKKSGSRS